MTRRSPLPLAALLAACVSDPPTNSYAPLDPEVDPITEGAWVRLGVDATWQWQLTTAEGVDDIDTSYDVDVYDIDLFEVDAARIAGLQAEGRVVICYFSAGSWEEWREDAGEFDEQDIGSNLDGWPGERWLNIRSPAVFEQMLVRLDLAVAKGCDGVEPDNVEAYAEDSGFLLTADDQLAFNRRLANAAHERGLAIALKNAGSQATELVEYFDLSLNEQCHEYDECEQLQPFLAAGKPIFNAEYVEPDDEATALARAQTLCPIARAEGIRTLLLPLELDDRFRVSCD
ncbi:endo alpha-1,4 polygalactosaminidase [Nannocystaceae bacterium ST9]